MAVLIMLVRVVSVREVCQGWLDSPAAMAVASLH